MAYTLLVALVSFRASYKVSVTGRLVPRVGPQSLNSPLERGFGGVILRICVTPWGGVTGGVMSFCGPRGARWDPLGAHWALSGASDVEGGGPPWVVLGV